MTDGGLRAILRGLCLRVQFMSVFHNAYFLKPQIFFGRGARGEGLKNMQNRVKVVLHLNI
jgi:hypothetical protein